ncbi:hypothetical protein ACWIDS_16130 [Dietzia maris]
MLFILGALIPIWSIATLPPVVFDAARYGLGLLLVARLWTVSGPTVRGVASWAVPIALTGVLVALFTWQRGDSPSEGVIMAGAAILAWAVTARVPNPWPLFLGFATSATVSGLVLIGSASGIGIASALTPNQDAGTARLTGVGSSAVRVSLELAIAIVIWVIANRARRGIHVVPVLGVLICSIAILMCGGRTGIVGLGLALLVSVVRGWIKPLLALLIAAGTAIAVRQTLQATEPGAFNTLDRLLGPTDERYGGFSSGRADLFAAAWEGFRASPITGVSDTQAHFAPLYFAALGGVVAGLIILWLTTRLLFAQFVSLGDRATRPEATAAVLISAVFLVAALLEPYGPFFGFEFCVLLFGWGGGGEKTPPPPHPFRPRRRSGARR